MSRALSERFTFWVMQPQKDKGEVWVWGVNLKEVITVSTTQQFWQFFQHLKSMSQLPECDINLFKVGVRPEWEDPANQGGHYFVIKIAKKKTDKLWECATFALVNPNNSFIDLTNGIRLKIRKSFDHLQIWMNSKCMQKERLAQFQEYLKEALQISDERVFQLHAFTLMQK